MELDSSSDEDSLSEEKADGENSNRTSIREPGARRTRNRRLSRHQRPHNIDRLHDAYDQLVGVQRGGPPTRQCQLFE